MQAESVRSFMVNQRYNHSSFLLVVTELKKCFLILSIFYFIPGCSTTGKSDNIEDSSIHKTATVLTSNDSAYVQDTSINGLSAKKIVITVSFAAIECGCPQWFETKFKDVKLLEDVERFYLEPVSNDLVNANDLWDGEHLQFTLKITGNFSKEKEVPVSYHTKGVPEKARIFWYDKITVVSQSSNKGH